MATVYLSLGSNVGDRLALLRRALQELQSIVLIGKVSSVFETTPVGIQNQGNFLNMAVCGTTSLGPEELMNALLAIEKSLGRVRENQGGPRTLDIDILFYDHITWNDANLRIPHPRYNQRLFVLAPLCQINEQLICPVLQKSMKTLRMELNTQEQVVPVAQLPIPSPKPYIETN